MDTPKEELHFPVKLNLRLDWSEMDMFGHINNVMYAKYVQASRVNYWEVAKFDGDYRTKKIGPLLLSTSIRFIKPLFYPGNITVQVRVEYIKNTSFGLHHYIINDKGEVAAEAQDVIVLFDYNKNEKVIIPDSIRQLIEHLEKKKF
jgi:acyl-CoA thioester hydrolase